MDLDILSKVHQVQELSKPLQGWKRRPLLEPQAWLAVRQSDLVFGWFGTVSDFSTIARLSGKPSILVAGGFDAVTLPETRYGLGEIPLAKRLMLLLGYRCTTRILLFSNASKDSLAQILGGHDANLSTLYLGVDTHSFSPSGLKLPRALSIGHLNSSSYIRKGIRTFIEAAKLTPSVDFLLGGKIHEQQLATQIRLEQPANLNILGELTQDELLKKYQESMVYVQVSHHEGFGMALAEAMACECLPVVTDRGSIPEVVGDTGLYVPVDDAQATSQAVLQAIQEDHQGMRQRARQRICDRFPLAQRETGLLQLIEQIG